MNELSKTNANHDSSVSYEIRVVGHLHDRLKEWFGGMNLRCNEDGTTTLFGALPDQNALHSILLKIRDMNLTLISVTHCKANSEEEL
jgi:hypothetical protein